MDPVKPANGTPKHICIAKALGWTQCETHPELYSMDNPFRDDWTGVPPEGGSICTVPEFDKLYIEAKRFIAKIDAMEEK